jgi:hypothetical protein
MRRLFSILFLRSCVPTVTVNMLSAAMTVFQQRESSRRHQQGVLVSMFSLDCQTTLCEGKTEEQGDINDSSGSINNIIDRNTAISNIPESERLLLLQQIRQQKQFVQSELDRLGHENNDTCPSCLYVGVVTCVGLAGYFANIAFEETSNTSTTATTTNIANAASRRPSKLHKPIFLLISLGWLCAGAYRWKLG